MAKLENALVEAKLIKVIDEIKDKFKIKADVDIEFCPENFISSQVLVTVTGRIAVALGVTIPENCYIFHDKKTLKKYSIKEAAEKLIKEAKYEK
jgi:hypothetical protein